MQIFIPKICRVSHQNIHLPIKPKEKETQVTFYVPLTSQDQAGTLLQVLSHLLSSKLLFWYNLPLSLLYEYFLNCRVLHWIPLFLLPSNCCFFFDFPVIFLIFTSYHHFFLNFPIPPPCSRLVCFSLILNFFLFFAVSSNRRISLIFMFFFFLNFFFNSFSLILL